MFISRTSQPHQSTPFDWIALLILSGLVLTSSWAVIATDWTEDLGLIALTGFLGAWAGSALGHSRFRAWMANIIAAAYGAFVCGWQLGLTFDDAFAWRERIEILFGRLGVFLSKLIVGEPNEDPFIFVVLMAGLFWILSVWGGWSVFRRHSAWGAILPFGLTVAIVINYYFGPSRLGFFLGTFSLLALILAGRMDIFSRSFAWERQRARVPVDTVYRVSIMVLIASVLIVALAWGGPAFAKSENLSLVWRSLTRPFDTIKDRFENAFDTIEGPTRVIPSEYGETLTLAAGTQPINRLVMTVDPLGTPSRGGRFYWRSRVYDEYRDRQWFVPPAQTEEFDPEDGEINLVAFEGRELIEVKFAPADAAIKLLYLPPQPLWLNRSSDVKLIRYNEITVDVLEFEANRFIREGESYNVITSLAVPTALQLRGAGENYPGWVLLRNLQLPADITQRTRDLAIDITEGLETPYDKAVAITRWLRENIEYNRVIEAPPPDVEPIDWFLFEHKIGFCNYYASAEVVMLRSLGIPARLAGGYARGDFNASQGNYEVYGEDSHSWPEVFFPGIGWVEFEPTVSQPVLVRPEGVEEEVDSVGGPEEGAGLGDPLSDEDRLPEEADIDQLSEGGFNAVLRARIIRGIGYGLLGGLVLLFGWVRINPASWAGVRVRIGRLVQWLQVDLPPTVEVQSWEWDTYTGRTYAGWSAWLKRLGLSHGPWETPSERIAVFSTALPESAEAGQALVGSYIRERFAGETIDEQQVRGAWRSLQPKLWLAWLWKLTARWRRQD